MPVKPALKPTLNEETPVTSAKETARPARKTPARVSTAKHRNTRTKETASVNVESSQEIVASIAYGYWEARGFQGGDAFDDWMRAEQEYQSRANIRAVAAGA